MDERLRETEVFTDQVADRRAIGERMIRNRRPRLSAIFHLADVSGPAKTLAPRLRHLAGPYDVEVVAPALGPVLGLCADVAGGTVLDYEALTFPASPRALLRWAGSAARDVALFRRYVARRDPDAVVVVTSALPAALVGARLAGAPAIVYAAEMFDRRFVRTAARRGAARVLAQLTLASSAAIVCPSHAVARQFGGEGGHVAVIPPGIAPTGPGDRTRLRAAHGIADDALCIAVVGNISEGRGQDVAIRALARIRRHVGDACCLFAGVPHPRAVDVAYRRSLADLAERLGVGERVAFAGFVDDVADVYAAADVVVAPARMHEGFGRVALEALLAGRPVVATRVGAIPEVLEDGREALLVNADDPEAIADAVLRLRADPDLAAGLVSAGRALVADRYAEEDGVAAFAQIVSAVIGRERAGRETR